MPGNHQYRNANPYIWLGFLIVSEYDKSLKIFHITENSNHDIIIQSTNTIAKNVFFI